jgi:hypothetical protein
MTKLVGGPAAGVSLSLSRAPMFLRVVRSITQEWDALDLLDDRPSVSEDVFVYKLESHEGTVHVDGRDKKTGKRFSKWLVSATYNFFQYQPTEEELRDTNKWRLWCQLMGDK